MAHDSEVLVIGGGLAGSSVATLLARAGRSARLLEQHASAHDKVCGEFLSHEALHYLRALGVDPVTLGAVPITHVRFCSGHAVTERALPFPAMSLTRRTLDEALLASAYDSGVCIVRKRVESLERSDAGWQAAIGDGQQISAHTAFLATGKHDLRGHVRPPGRQNTLIGIKMYFQLSPLQTVALQEHVELFTFPGGYAGLQPVEHGAANLCALVDGHTYKRLGGTWPALLAHMMAGSPHLAGRLAGAEALLDRPLAIARIPYGLVRPSPGAEGLWLLGDQAAVIPSFSGDGMSIALHTAHAAARAYLRGETSNSFANSLHRQLHLQVRLATLVSQALVAPALQPLLRASVNLFPSVLTLLAKATRIPPSAIVRA